MTNIKAILVKRIYPLAKLYWFIFRPKTFGVRGIIYDDNKVLMIRNTYGNNKFWMFPGGGIKKGESPEAAFKREIKEETNLDLININKIGEYDSKLEYKSDHVTVFAAENENKNQLKADAVEILELKWFGVNDLPDISPYSKKILSMWKNHKIL